MASQPTIAQQWAVAYAPKPFAIISLFSSAYVVHHLLCRHPEKRKRLYHRLVLAMNLAFMPISFVCFYGSWAMPSGTPGYIGTAGTVQSCTASGFILIMLAQTFPFYYGSLALQSVMAIRNNFKEENYVWIEKWLHLVAWIFPCVITTILAATENINPNAATCWLTKAPRGCEYDPEIACERGRDITWVINVFGLGQYSVYFVYPPLGVLAIFLYLKKMQRRVNSSDTSGMQIITLTAQKQVLRNVAVQISVYLLSFWFTTVFLMIGGVYQMMTGIILYNLNIFGNVIYSAQGFVIAVVYFSLEKMGGRGSKRQQPSRNLARQLTVSEIEEPITFHIFDAAPDENSTWTAYFNQDSNEYGDDTSVGDEPVEIGPWPNDSLE